MDLPVILELVNTTGIIGILVLGLALLLRGDLVPRKVWNDLTAEIVKETVSQVLKELGLPLRADRGS